MPKSDVLKFIKKILLFLPLLVFFGVPALVLFASGEMISVPQINQMYEHRDKPYLIGLVTTSFWSYYKLQAIIKYHPDVITLGDSRVGEFRSAFFNKNTKFFNASHMIIRMSDFGEFLNLIPKGHEPKLIIIGLDQVYFNSVFDENSRHADFSDRMDENKLPSVSGIMWDDYIHKKFTLKDIFEPKREGLFGLLAIKKHSGFRRDGSFYYGDVTENPDSPETKNRMEGSKAILNGTGRYPFCSEIKPRILNELIYFLAQCKLRNIHVIGYLPPYAHFQIEQFQSMGDKDAFMLHIHPILSDIFNQYHFDFFDFSDLSQLGASDEEMIDDQHSSEKATLRVFIIMAMKDKELEQYANNLEFLLKRLTEARGPFSVFKEDEF